MDENEREDWERDLELIQKWERICERDIEMLISGEWELDE